MDETRMRMIKIIIAVREHPNHSITWYDKHCLHWGLSWLELYTLFTAVEEKGRILSQRVGHSDLYFPMAGPPLE